MRNKFCRVPNACLEAMARLNMSSYETRLMAYVMRQTFGYHRPAVPLNTSRLAREIELSRQNVHRALKSLEARRILEVRTNVSGKRLVGVQADATLWLERAPRQEKLNFAAAPDKAYGRTIKKQEASDVQFEGSDGSEKRKTAEGGGHYPRVRRTP